MPWLLDWFKSPRRKAADCFEKGRLALDQNDFDLAISWFNACIHHDPTGDTGFFGRGFAQLKKAMGLGAQIDGADGTGGPDEVFMALRAALREMSLHDLDAPIRALAAKS